MHPLVRFDNGLDCICGEPFFFFFLFSFLCVFVCSVGWHRESRGAHEWSLGIPIIPNMVCIIVRAVTTAHCATVGEGQVD